MPERNSPATVEFSWTPWPPIRSTVLPVFTPSFSASASPMMMPFGARERSSILPSRICAASFET